MLYFRHISAVLLLFVLFFLPDFLLSFLQKSFLYTSAPWRCTLIVWVLISAFIYFVWPHIYGDKHEIRMRSSEYSSSYTKEISKNFGYAYAVLLIASAVFFVMCLSYYSDISFYADRSSIACSVVLAFLSYRKYKQYDDLTRSSED